MESDIGPEARFMPTSPAFGAPFTGGARGNITMTFGTEKLEWCGYPTVEYF